MALAAIAGVSMAGGTAAQTVEPEIVSFFGGDGAERAQGLWVAPNGKVYVAGQTSSANLFDKGVAPDTYGSLPGHDQSPAVGSGTGYVARFSADLHHLEAWTFVGGTDGPSGRGARAYTVRTDRKNNVYVWGFTSSPSFGASAIGGPLRGSRDCFLSKFDENLERPTGPGQPVFWDLVLGGANERPGANGEWEQGRNTLVVDAEGNCYVSGGTPCNDHFVGHNVNPVTAHAIDRFPGVNPYNFDAFVAKVGKNGVLRWGTFFGGSGDESAYSGIVLKPNGSVVVAGNTNQHVIGTNPPQYWPNGLPGTANRFQETYQGGWHGGNSSAGYHHVVGGDGFVAKIGKRGDLRWATYLGGNAIDFVAGNDGLWVAPEDHPRAGSIYVTGGTRSGDFPVTGATAQVTPFQATHSGGDSTGQIKADGFVTILSPGARNVWRGTFIGGTGFEEMSGIDVDARGHVFVSGNTSSGLINPVNGAAPYTPYPTTNGGSGAAAYQQRNWQQATPISSSDPVTAFVTKFEPELDALRYSSYMGGGIDVTGTPSSRDRGRELQLVGRRVYVAGGTNSSDFARGHGLDSGTYPPGIGTLDPNTGSNTDGFVLFFDEIP